MFRVALFLFLFLASSSVVFADCLNEVSNFAEKICGEIQKSGSRQLIEANGELKAEISGIVRKALGEVKGGINGKILQETYENVLREDLSKELFNVRECRQKMVETAFSHLSEVCPSSAHTNKTNSVSVTTHGENSPAISGHHNPINYNK
ncbi:MAG: hypothetical protein WCK96_04700 [Methylococcales bacterium]